ncbi:inner membrane-spanning protein YciB [Terricaulis silvestris]|uniref:Inner membrane-spanning protein YciB n=1 Tax=Terricaulis silvestris TaxID=2686094 RepID=A0A6I6ML03_9CAUL|nr:septation protein IspZ [Terricaulis silvestris]QGZ95369.1 Intracellular septation protein [Terricaulis silvestris]
MTDTPTDSQPAKAQAAGGAGQLWVDLGPVLVFVVAFNVLHRIEATKDDAIYIAIGLFIAATLIAIGWCKLKRGKIPPVLIVTGVLVTAFGGLTILLHDPSIIQIKFTVTFLFYAAAIFISVLIRQNVWKLLFRHLFNLPDRIWTVLALRWATFYVAVAILNEVLRYFYNEANGNFDVWLNLRTLLTYPAFIVFALLNTPIVLKHQIEDDAPVEQQPAAPSA